MHKLKNTKIISVTELRRKFGEIAKHLADYDSVILTRGGRPFAVLRPTSEARREYWEKARGAWKDSALDDDGIWEKTREKASRKNTIDL